LRTKTVHSEILWALSPNNNITEAIRRFGVSDDTTALFVVRIGPPELENPLGLMKTIVSGELSPIHGLAHLTDWATIKKYYKLNNDPAIKFHSKNDEQIRVAVNEIVVSIVAMKSVMT